MFYDFLQAVEMGLVFTREFRHFSIGSKVRSGRRITIKTGGFLLHFLHEIFYYFWKFDQ